MILLVWMWGESAYGAVSPHVRFIGTPQVRTT
jgi:hypothetical protein